MLDAHTTFSPDCVLKKSEYRDLYTQMESKKLTYAEVLKNQSGYLNVGMEPRPLIPKAPRVRLSEEALTKLRSVISNESTVKPTSEVKKSKGKNSNPKATTPTPTNNNSGPLILATASDWIVSGKVMSSSVYDKKSDDNS